MSDELLDNIRGFCGVVSFIVAVVCIALFALSVSPVATVVLFVSLLAATAVSDLVLKRRARAKEAASAVTDRLTK